MRGVRKQEVLGRLVLAEDLIAADAVYHNKCSVNFRNSKSIPVQLRPEYVHGNVQELGRPEQEERSSFLAVMTFLEENDDEQLTVTDSRRLMKVNLTFNGADHDAYSMIYMKQK
jgi:hypothetical protein